MTNFNLPKPHLPHVSPPHPLTSSQLPFPGGSLWRSLWQGALSTWRGKHCIAHCGVGFFFCHWKCLPTSHIPYKLLASKARNLAFVSDDPTVQSTFSQQEKVPCNFVSAHGNIACRGLPVGEPLQHSSPQLSEGAEGLQDIHLRLGFSPPTCHKKEISLQRCRKASRFWQGQMRQQVHGYFAAPDAALSQEPALPVPRLCSDVENDSWKKYCTAIRKAGLEREGSVLLFLGKIPPGT